MNKDVINKTMTRLVDSEPINVELRNTTASYTSDIQTFYGRHDELYKKIVNIAKQYQMVKEDIGGAIGAMMEYEKTIGKDIQELAKSQEYVADIPEAVKAVAAERKTYESLLVKFQELKQQFKDLLNQDIK